ncbi:MAG: MlaD family protein [Elusimicrobiota bacterium]
MNTETKVGLFILAALSVIIASALFLGKIHLFKKSHQYYVVFKNVEALPPKAAVKVAGVEIGKVDSVDLVDGQARVTIGINPKVNLHENATAQIGSTGIIGSKFIDLNPGTQSLPVLPERSTILGIEAVSLNEMIAKVGQFFEADPKHGDPVANLKEMISNLNNVSKSLNYAMGQHAAEMEEIVLNIRDLTSNIRVVSAHLKEITTEKKEDVKIAIEKIRSVSEKLDDILGRVKDGKGAVGALMSDDETGKQVKEAVASIKDTANSAKSVFARFRDIHTYWNYRYRYDFKDSEGRSDAGITIVPRQGKFYAFGASNIGKPETNEKHTQFERKNRINAVLGADFGPLTGYAGAIRSAGGFGVNLRPLFFLPKLEKKLELNVEASDFSRDRIVKGEHLNRAFLSAGGHFAVTRWMWLGARVEDILERSAFFAYTNISFEDKDLSYLLGLATVAR